MALQPGRPILPLTPCSQPPTWRKPPSVLQRPHTKGRDLYDLLWYLSDPDWPSPNLTLLNNALRQTDWRGRPVLEDTWRGVVRTRLAAAAWGQAVADVRPFLEPSADPALLTRKNLERLLATRRA